MLPLLFSNPWRTASLALVIALAITVQHVRYLDSENKRLEERTPLTITETKIIKVQGPERIKIVTVTRPDGEITETKEIVKEEVVTTTENAAASNPFTQAEPRRYLVGAGALVNTDGGQEFAFYLGRTFFNKVDLSLGGTTEKRLIALGSVRF